MMKNKYENIRLLPAYIHAETFCKNNMILWTRILYSLTYLV